MSEERAEPAAGLSARATGTGGSMIREMYDAANELGGDLVRLEIGEPDFTTPEHAIRAAFDATLAGETHYTSNAGTLELREAIADKMAAENGVEFDPGTEIMVGNGAMEAIYLALLTVVDPGDEVVVPTPAWPNYASQVSMVGGEFVPVELPADDGFALDADRVADAITPETAAVILNSPCNPTGQVYDAASVRAVVDAAAADGAYVLVDEIYEGLRYEGDQAAAAAVAERPEHVVVAEGCSKKYAMTGWRLGWIAGPAAVIDAATGLHESTTACASAVSQNAALAAITGDQAPVREMRAAFEDRRDYVVDRVADLPEISCPRPEGAFYAFLDCGALEGTSREVAERLLYDHGVVTAPGSGFADHADDYVRISFANGLDRLEAGFDRIEAMVGSELGG